MAANLASLAAIAGAEALTQQGQGELVTRDKYGIGQVASSLATVLNTEIMHLESKTKKGKTSISITLGHVLFFLAALGITSGGYVLGRMFSQGGGLFGAGAGATSAAGYTQEGTSVVDMLASLPLGGISGIAEIMRYV